ncbi:MAG: hypothetical protein ACYDC5_04480 [Candidatus Dormibacteria bacterium]
MLKELTGLAELALVTAGIPAYSLRVEVLSALIAEARATQADEAGRST